MCVFMCLLCAYMHVCGSLCRDEASWAFPCPVSMLNGVFLVQFKFGWCVFMLVNFMGVASDVTRTNNLTAISLISGSYNL